jgi:hypothetical protein
VRSEENLLNDKVSWLRDAFRKRGYIRTMEPILDKFLRTVDPVLAYNRWRLKRSCTLFGKGVKVLGKVDVRVRGNGEIELGIMLQYMAHCSCG